MIPSQSVNILFLGGAKRVAMAKLFKKAAAERGLGCNIFSYEAVMNVPISCIGTVITGLRWNDTEIYGHLEQLCDRYDIGIVIPFVDGAVAVASRLHERLPHVFTPTSSAKISEAMFDKVAAARIFEENGLPVPETYNGGGVVMPLIAKPRHGSASKGLIRIDSENELPPVETRDSFLIQRRIDNREEISVDCYVSEIAPEIRPLAIVPRRRLEVVGGEVVRSITIDDAAAADIVKKTLTSLGLRGAVTVQLLRDSDTGALYIMEINPRLGGGAVCAVHAGADIPGMIIDESRGMHCEVSAYRPGTEIARYLQEVVFYNE